VLKFKGALISCLDLPQVSTQHSTLATDMSVTIVSSGLEDQELSLQWGTADSLLSL
jgi:hypothetical protein